MPKLARVQRIVLPILRGHDDFEDPISILPELEGVKVGTWVEDIDFRLFPMINIRRTGGFRHPTRPTLLGKPVIEMTAFGIEGLEETEDLYETALEVLYEAVAKQTQTDYGYLHSIKETFGATQFSSLFMDSWRSQGLIQLGVRPLRAVHEHQPFVPDPVSHYDWHEGSGSSTTSLVGGYTLSSPDWVYGGGVGAFGPAGVVNNFTMAMDITVTDLPPLAGGGSIIGWALPTQKYINMDNLGRAGIYPEFSASTSLPLATRRLMVFVFTATTLKIYWDGTEVGSYTGTYAINPGVTCKIWSVADVGNEGLQYTMHDFRFWDSALNEDQVAAL